jgi:hypothetical protein
MKIARIASITAFVALAAHAASIDVSKLPPPAQKNGVTFEKDIKPLLEASCVRCHGPEKAKGELRLDSLEGVKKGSEHGAILKPGNSAGSTLVIAVSRLNPDLAMPPIPKERKGPQPTGQKKDAKPQGPPAKPLTPEEVGLIRAWIDQGAK